jgi:hypothetical protein
MALSKICFLGPLAFYNSGLIKYRSPYRCGEPSEAYTAETINPFGPTNRDRKSASSNSTSISPPTCRQKKIGAFAMIICKRKEMIIAI